MSGRLIGNCGYIVGESRYFRKINESSKLSDVLKIPQDYQYCNGLKICAGTYPSLFLMFIPI